MSDKKPTEEFNFFRGFLIAAGAGLLFYAVAAIIIFALWWKGIL